MFASRVFTKAATTTSVGTKKQLFILRHGQATHNPRAEAARAQGCSHEEFLEWMRRDDSLDSELTELGMSQARAVLRDRLQHHPILWSRSENTKRTNLELVVSSPLSRALQTADLAVPFEEPKRICREHFREINGWLQNAKRRSLTYLAQQFPNWDFTHIITEHDESWTPELETQSDCSERGYQGLSWILRRPESVICLVCHGGILRFAMNQHDAIRVVDGRENGSDRDVKGRFGNCELRRYSIEWDEEVNGEEETTTNNNMRRTIILTELDCEA